MKRRDVGAFVALLTLTGLSLGASYVPLGAWGMAVALGFAAIKVSVVAVVFMHLARSPRAEALFALGAVVVVAILVLLAAADVMTRA
ncbi:MAG: cytochrome C oxidase subunit IV family protein [Myxococcales bacterium]|nr:cytochrome C oxidase subunit IV family protein [Myxococcales bacterium]